MNGFECDLCGCSITRALPAWIVGTSPFALCDACGLVVTHPVPTESEMKMFYAKEFRDDPGAPAMEKNFTKENNQLRFVHERKRAEQEVIPRLKKHRNLSGAHCLDVRARLGAIMAELAEEGAQPEGLELFENNARAIRERLQLPVHLTKSVFDWFAPIEHKYDVITMLNDHVPAHAASPKRLFQSAFDALRPGGVLFVEEKDVSSVVPRFASFAIGRSTGRAHFFHFVPETLEAFVTKAGFVVLERGWFDRETAQRHFYLIAERPKVPLASSVEPALIAPDAMLRALAKARLKSAFFAPLAFVVKRALLPLRAHFRSH